MRQTGVLVCSIIDKDRTDAIVPFPSKLPPHSFLIANLTASASAGK